MVEIMPLGPKHMPYGEGLMVAIMPWDQNRGIRIETDALWLKGGLITKTLP